MTTSKFSDAALELTAAAEGALEISVQGAKLIVEDASNYEVHWTAKQEAICIKYMTLTYDWKSYSNKQDLGENDLMLRKKNNRRTSALHANTDNVDNTKCPWISSWFESNLFLYGKHLEVEWT